MLPIDPTFISATRCPSQGGDDSTLEIPRGDPKGDPKGDPQGQFHPPGVTALMLASSRGCTGAMRLLLSCKAKPRNPVLRASGSHHRDENEPFFFGPVNPDFGCGPNAKTSK